MLICTISRGHFISVDETGNLYIHAMAIPFDLILCVVTMYACQNNRGLWQ